MGRILDAMTKRQDQCGFLSDTDLESLARELRVPLYQLEGLVSFYPHFKREPGPEIEVLVCRDVACRLAGGSRWSESVDTLVSGIEGAGAHRVSCLGQCDIAPAVSINEHPCTLAALKDRLAVPPNKNERPKRRREIRGWKSDPYATAEDRYSAVTALRKSGFQDVVTTLTESGLRGMGGAGFPTGKKWSLVAAERAEKKYVVCNADESEPGTFKDRVVLDELAHLVIEGMAIAAGAIGSDEGIIFIRHEYLAERYALVDALAEARRKGVLGPEALGRDEAGAPRPFDIRIAVSPGGYILGEETALLECLEDKRGEPRNKPPFPGQQGLFGKPTLINNVETFSYVPIILKEGASAWRARGMRGSSGLKFIALSGDVECPDTYQVPMGTTIGELVALAGGVKGQKKVLAIAPGGASSNFLGPDAMDAPLDFQALTDRGSMLGSGAVFVVAEGADILDLATNIVTFFRNESCGKCVPCRVGSEKAVTMLERASLGKGSKRHLELLPELEHTMAQSSICGLGQVALAPFLSVLQRFPEEVRKRFTEE